MIKTGEALFGKTRRAILNLLFLNSNEDYYYRQIVQHAGVGQGTVLRELKKLTSAGILMRRKVGKQVFYRANNKSSIFKDLKAVIVKTTGLADTIRDALQSLDISFAFIFGSYALGTEIQESDVDVMVIGSVKYEDVVGRLWEVGRKIERDVNPVVYDMDGFLNMLHEGDNFLNRVLDSEKIYLYGGEDELRRVIRRRSIEEAPNEQR